MNKYIYKQRRLRRAAVSTRYFLARSISIPSSIASLSEHLEKAINF